MKKREVKKKGKKGKKDEDNSEEEEDIIDSEDSLNEFIASDSDEIEYQKPKKKKAKT